MGRVHRKRRERKEGNRRKEKKAQVVVDGKSESSR